MIGAAAIVLAAAPRAPPHAPRPPQRPLLRGHRAQGILPNATATVWNTIGLNRCPARWWNAFDAADLAKERGATAVVLNGPRYFLMDSVTATPGRVRSFHGEKMRRVATIPIHSAADLARTPYTDRVVKRRNTWTWNRGRVVYELVAPGGDVYVMQAYAQIVEPEAADRSAALARAAARPAARLALPRAPPAQRAGGQADQGQRHDRPGRAPEHVPAVQEHAPARAAQAPRREPRGPDPHGRGRTRREPSRTRAPSRARRSAPARSSSSGRSRTRRFTGTFRLLFKRDRSSAPPTLPFTIAGEHDRLPRHGALHGGNRRLPRHLERRAPGPRHEHARRPERRDLGRGLRDLLAAPSEARQRRLRVPLSAQACSRRCRSRSSSCSAPGPAAAGVLAHEVERLVGIALEVIGSNSGGVSPDGSRSTAYFQRESRTQRILLGWPDTFWNAVPAWWSS